MGTKVRAEDLINGMVLQRQGSTTGAGSWASGGTSNTSLANTDTIIQVGSALSSAGGAVTVTFPTAFSQAPVVVLSIANNGSAAIPVIDTEATTTGFAFAVWNLAAGLVNAKNVHWIAIGQ